MYRFITADETWVHHNTPETKQQSKQWSTEYEPTQNMTKTIPPAGKVMATIVWDKLGIIDYFENTKTNSGEYYMNLLCYVAALFHQDNVLAQISIAVMAKMKCPLWCEGTRIMKKITKVYVGYTIKENINHNLNFGFTFQNSKFWDTRTQKAGETFDKIANIQVGVLN